MTDEQLTAILAQRVMGWRIGLDRFLLKGRGWKPVWTFRPTERREDAIRLLEAVKPAEYNVAALRGGAFRVRVRIGQTVGTAQHISEACAISHAVARAIGIEPDENRRPKTGADRQ